MTLSVVMVVMNQENSIERALNSVKSLTDDIIIYDGGSTDSTIDIARKFSNNIRFFELNNNSLLTAHAKNDWILELSGDEELILGEDNIGKHLDNLNNDVCFIKITSIINTDGNFDKLLDYQPRIFKKECLSYTRRKKNKEKSIGFITGEIINRGYLNKENLLYKLGLYKFMGKDEKARIEIKLQNGLVKYFLKDYDGAKMELLDAWDNCDDKRNDGHQIALFLVRLLIEQGKNQQALDFISRSISFYPDSADLLYYKGLAFLGNNKTPEAIDSLLTCKKIKKNKVHFPTLEGSNSYKASYILGVIFQGIDNHKEATKYLISTIKEKKDHVRALEDLIYSLKKITYSANEIKREIAHHHIDELINQNILAKGLYNNGLLAEVLDITNKDIRDNTLKLTKVKALINIGNIAEAKEILKDITPEDNLYSQALLELAILYLITNKEEQSNTTLKKLSILGHQETVEIINSVLGCASYDTSHTKEDVYEMIKRIVETKNLGLIEKAEKFLDKNQELYYYILLVADHLDKIGQGYLAIRWYKKALQKGYISFKSAVALGEYTLEVKEYRTAEKLFNKAIEINPYHYTPYQRLAQLYLMEADMVLKMGSELTIGGQGILLKRQSISNALETLAKEDIYDD